jgi:hypothetical protein
MATAIIDGITTRYEVVGSGPQAWEQKGHGDRDHRRHHDALREASFFGEAMGRDEVGRHAVSPRVLGANSSSAVTDLVMMPCVSAWPISVSITLRLGTMP